MALVFRCPTPGGSFIRCDLIDTPVARDSGNLMPDHSTVYNKKKTTRFTKHKNIMNILVVLSGNLDGPLLCNVLLFNMAPGHALLHIIILENSK